MINVEEYKRLVPHDYQEEDIAKLVKGVEMAALDATEMGGGKTLKAVECLLRRGDKRILIIAPLNTHDSWKKTILGQSEGRAKVYVHPPGSSTGAEADAWWTRVDEHQEGWFILGWEAFVGKPTETMKANYQAAVELAEANGSRRPPRWANLDWARTGQWDAVVADECHRMANRRSVTWATAESIIANSNYRLALSGTPARNQVEGYWAILYWLWPHRFGADQATKGYWKWVNQVCATKKVPGIGKMILGEKYPGAAVQSIPLYIRRTLEEVAENLPPVIERRVEVPLTNRDQRRHYLEFEAHAFTWVEDHGGVDESEGRLPLMTRLPMIYQMRLTQLALGVPRVTKTNKIDGNGFPVLNVDFSLDCKSSKIDAVKDIIQDIDPDEPIVVFTHSAKFAKAVVHQLNKKKFGRAVALVEGVTHAERKQILATFGREGGPRILVAGIAKIAEGTDGLQDVCRNEIWLSRHGDNVLNQQAMHRLWRPGQKDTVQRWLLISQGTVEEEVVLRTDANRQKMREAYALR